MKKVLCCVLAFCLLFAGCGSNDSETKSDSKKVSKYLETADKHYSKGEYEEAIFNYTKAIEEDSDNEDAYYGLIDAYMLNKDYEKAQKYINKAIRKFDSDKAYDLEEQLEEMMEKEAEATPEPTKVPEATPEPTPEPTSEPTPEPTPVPEQVKMKPEEIYENCVDSIVWIQAGGARGTGFFIEEDVVLTNYHVIEGATTLFLIRSDESKAPILQVLGYAPNLDLAILKVGCTGKPIPFNTHGITVGEKTYAIGNPLGYSFTFSDGMVTNKEVVDHNWELKDAKVFMTNTPISSGNSGGPLLNEYGEAMGVTTAVRTDGQNLNFVVDISQVAKVSTKNPMSVEDFIRSESGSDNEMYEDEYKSGDPETAQIIEEGIACYGALNGGDVVDCYRFEIEQSATYYFSYVNEASEYISLGISDEYGEELMYEFTPGQDGEVVGEAVYIPKGTYCFVAYEIKGLQSNQAVEYGFMFELSDTAYEVEGNSGSPETAQNVLLSQGVLGSMTKTDSVDYYKIVIPKAGTYGIEYQTVKDGSAYLAVADSACEELLFVLYGGENDGYGYGEAKLAAGEYYIVVINASEQLRQTEEYAFYIEQVAGGQSSGGGTAPEQTDSPLGYIEGNYYVNDYLEFYFEMGSDWEYALAGDDADIRSNFDEYLEYYDNITEFEGCDGNERQNLTIEYFSFSEEARSEYASLSLEECLELVPLENLKKFYEDKGAIVTEAEKDIVRFCGVQTPAAAFLMDMNGEEIYVLTFFFFQQGEYGATLSVACCGDGEFEELSNRFSRK